MPHTAKLSGSPFQWNPAHLRPADALLSGAEKLAELFPDLWGTPKAAERWFGNNPLNPYTFLIRLSY